MIFKGGKMKTKIVLAFAVLVLAALLIGCKSSNDYGGYATYQQGAQGQPQGQYVGGGCGVAPQADYESTPTIDSVNGL